MKSKDICIVLAAGASSRMGSNKMLLPWNATTVLGQVIQNVLDAGLAPCIVLGNQALEIKKSLAGIIDDECIVINEQWRDGMLTSIQAGIRTVYSSFVYILHGDMPLITGEMLQYVSAKFHEPFYQDYEVLFPCYNSRRGHPVLLYCSLYEDILNLPPADKLFPFLNRRKCLAVNFPFPELCMDIDTKEEYAIHNAGHIQ